MATASGQIQEWPPEMEQIATLDFDDAMRFEDMQKIDDFVMKDVDLRVQSGFPFQVNRETCKPLDTIYASIPADLNAVLPRVRVGEMVSVISLSQNGQLEAQLISTTRTFRSIFNTTPEICLKSSFELLNGYEVEHDVSEHLQDMFHAVHPKKNYVNRFTSDFVQGPRGAARHLDIRMKHISRYLRPCGKLVVVLAGIVIDLTSIIEAATLPPLRLEHFLGSLLCRQNELLIQGRYGHLMGLFDQAKDILAGAVSQLTLSTTSQLEDFDDETPARTYARIVSNEEDATADMRNNVEEHCSMRSNTFIRPEHLLSHSEVRIDYGPVLSQMDVLQFIRCPNNALSEDMVNLPYPIVMSRFVIPVLDLAALHGNGKASADIIEGAKLEIKLCVSVKHLPIEIAESAIVCGRIAGYTLAERAHAMQRDLQAMGLSIQWQRIPIEDDDNCELLTVTLSGVLCLDPMAPLTIQHSVNASSLDHASPQSIHSDQQEIVETRLSRSSSTSEIEAREARKTSDSLRERMQNLSFLTRMGTHIIFIEDQATLAQMLWTVADRHTTFDRVSTMVTPEDISIARVVLKTELQAANRLILVMDEHLYTLDHERLERVFTSGTSLRDDFLSIPAIHSAYESRRLIIASYSTADVSDSRIHLSRRKGTHTPRTLINDLATYIATLPSPTNATISSRRATIDAGTFPDR